MVYTEKLLFTVFVSRLIVVNSCTTYQYECANGQCILANKRCDENFDCNDFSDEANCSPTNVCPEGLYRCDSGQCVDADARCNGKQQCNDGSDEDRCNPYSSQHVSDDPTILGTISARDSGTSVSPGWNSISSIYLTKTMGSVEITLVGPSTQTTTVSTADHSLMHSNYISVSKTQDSNSYSNAEGIQPSPVSTFQTSTAYEIVSSSGRLDNSFRSTTQSVESSQNQLSHHYVESKSTSTTPLYSSLVSPKPTDLSRMTRTLDYAPRSLIQSSTEISTLTVKPSAEIESGLSKLVTYEASTLYTTIQSDILSFSLSSVMSTTIAHPKSGITPKEKDNKYKIIIPIIAGTFLLVVITMGILLWRRSIRSKNSNLAKEVIGLT